ncbi:YHS domain-containing (seleno)protein [Flavivirga aquimarina]|uniref:YHS domain-containing (Seleno)protein n=1 Tax=Flavivirga aquimarina TaxID=2027862 RepID=A0ABT8WCW9_9FLAO|nr:YHS domain-containing (seleno)protein [Flavivirga aquimarina]MDO5970970.1 YHS domain-containing (seleno)protein [Flavivirga aquimarina]
MKQNLKNGIAAQGYDVVSFFNGSPKKGNEAYTSTYNDAKYLFASLEDKEEFEKSPEAYTPQYGGFCAIAMSEEKEVNPNPKSWEVRDGKLYFFTRMLFGIIDAKRQWVKKPEELRALADTAWAKMNA